MNTVDLTYRVLQALHSHVFNSKFVTGLEDTILFASDERQVGVVFIGYKSSLLVNPDRKKSMQDSSVLASYVQENCAEGIDSYYLFNPPMISKALEDEFFRNVDMRYSFDSIKLRTWGECFVSFENFLIRMVSHLVRREWTAKYGTNGIAFRTLENTIDDLCSHTMSRDKIIESLVRNIALHTQRSQEGWSVHSVEDQVDAFLVGELVEKFLLSWPRSSSILNHGQLLSRVAQIIKSGASPVVPALLTNPK